MCLVVVVVGGEGWCFLWQRGRRAEKKKSGRLPLLRGRFGHAPSFFTASLPPSNALLTFAHLGQDFVCVEKGWGRARGEHFVRGQRDAEIKKRKRLPSTSSPASHTHSATSGFHPARTQSGRPGGEGVRRRRQHFFTTASLPWASTSARVRPRAACTRPRHARHRLGWRL